MKSFLPFLWKKELRDLKLILVLTLGVPLCWMIFLKWNFDLSISSNDATKILFPFYPDLVREHGNWQSILYRPELLGGFIIEGYFGSYPITRTLAFLGLSPLSCLNFTFLAIQVLYGFLSLRIAIDLKECWDPKPTKSSLLQVPGYLGLGLLNTFLPLIAWRMSYGHPNIISGSFLFLSFVSLILAKKLENLTLTCLSLNIIALINCFQYQSHQMALYSIVFGGPILIGLTWPREEQKLRAAIRPLLLPILVAFGSFAYSLEVFWPFFSHAISSDTARSILGQNITYSYLTATVGDWLSSIPWSRVLVFVERESRFLHHEVNYPIGPVLLLLFLVPWRGEGKQRWIPLGIGLITSCCMALAFSMNLEPISEILSSIIPPLKFFRVPARSILPLAILIPALGSAALLARDNLAILKKETIIFLALGFTVLLFPSETREIFLWIICLYSIIQSKLKISNQKHTISAGAFLLILGLGSLMEFKDRLLPFKSESMLETAPSFVKQELYQQAPELKSSLTRIILDFEPEPYSFNRGYPSGISTLAGYFSPPARFLHLYFALADAPPQIMTQAFDFNESTPGYYPLRELYNVVYKAREINGHYQVAQLAPNNNGAWFSKQLNSLPDMTQLALALKAQGKGLRNYLQNFAIYLTEDPLIKKAGLPKQVSPFCSDAQVLEVIAPQHAQIVKLRVKSPENCPLTVSMNYVEILEAVGKSETGVLENLKVFPVNGALTGILVSKGTTSIELAPKANIPAFVTLIHILGGLMLLSLLGATLANYRRAYTTGSATASS
ncbi:MAG: hypothetical protein ABIQ95_16865 [Bdellovibrionia bacterium]